MAPLTRWKAFSILSTTLTALAARAVNVVLKIENAFHLVRGAIRGWFKKNRTCAVAEKHASGAIFVIENGGHGIAADGEHFFVGARAYKLRADSESVSEAGTGCGKIESPGSFCADAILNQARGSGEEHIRSDAGDDDQADFGGVGIGVGEELLGGFGGHVRRGHTFVDDVTLTDAGASANPLVVGVHNFFQVGVGHHAWRQETGYACNLRCNAMRHDAPYWNWHLNRRKGSLCDAACRVQVMRMEGGGQFEF